MGVAEGIATRSNRGGLVIGLKSTVDGKFGNVLFDNKLSLKNLTKYTYWSGAHKMWIIDFDSAKKIVEQSWYDESKIEIVEAKYK